MHQLDKLHLAIEMVEHHVAYPGMERIITEISEELQALFDLGQLEQPLFDELNSRLLLRIAQVENALSRENGLTIKAEELTIVG